MKPVAGISLCACPQIKERAFGNSAVIIDGRIYILQSCGDLRLSGNIRRIGGNVPQQCKTAAERGYPLAEFLLKAFVSVKHISNIGIFFRRKFFAVIYLINCGIFIICGGDFVQLRNDTFAAFRKASVRRNSLAGNGGIKVKSAECIFGVFIRNGIPYRRDTSRRCGKQYDSG